MGKFIIRRLVYDTIPESGVYSGTVVLYGILFLFFKYVKVFFISLEKKIKINKKI